MLAIEPAPCEPGQGRSGTFDEHAPPAFHNAALEQRFVGESELRAGPVFDWIRVGVPLLPDHPLTPLQRVAAAVDNASGVSSVLPADSHSFINPDLTVHLFRPLIGEWVGMASVTHHSIHGVGMTDTAIFDRDGRIGRSNQSLVLDLR